MVVVQQGKRKVVRMHRITERSKEDPHTLAISAQEHSVEGKPKSPSPHFQLLQGTGASASRFPSGASDS